MTPFSIDRRDFGVLTLGALGAAALAREPQRDGWTSLWNGKDLDGWTTWLQKPNPTAEVFSVMPDYDGGRPAIRVSGEIFGELRSARAFQDYHLKFQFKWGEKKWPPRDAPTTKRDSGLLYHVHAAPGAEGRTWARSVELQIQEGDVGDLYAVGSAIAVRAKVRPGSQPAEYVYDPSGTWTYFSQIAGQTGRCIKQPDNELPHGQWNTVELVCLGADCLHIVNGTVVMRLYGPTRIDGAVPAPVTSGAIILQSEGAEIYYRDVMVRSITAIPAEYR